MRILSFLLATTLFFASKLNAAEPDFDFEELMEGVEFNLNEMQTSISLEEKEPAIKLANELKASFHKMEGFFAAWGYADDAVKSTQEYQQRADRVVELINTDKFNEAYEVSVEFSNHCKACHDNYKPLP